MNREIKFRGKRIDNGEWVYGCLLLKQSRFGGSHHYIYVDSDDIEEEGIEYSVDANTVGQFTGVHDKANDPIYEGDIVRFVRPSTYPDFYEIPMCINFNPTMGFHPYIQGIGHYDDWQYHLSEIIGNIYENPELLNN